MKDRDCRISSGLRVRPGETSSLGISSPVQSADGTAPNRQVGVKLRFEVLFEIDGVNKSRFRNDALVYLRGPYHLSGPS